MTNTRITDPEIFEKRYPVILHEFSIREGKIYLHMKLKGINIYMNTYLRIFLKKGSGGDGFHKGGDGVVRDIEFLEDDVQVSILSERRVFQPYGLKGGEDGKVGLNLWLRKDINGNKKLVNLGGKNSSCFKKGDHIVILTPGAGGYGKPSNRHPIDDDDDVREHPPHKRRQVFPLVKAGGSLASYTDMAHSA